MSGEVITRYANRAGAVVELHTARFMTTWTRSGPPYAANKPYEVDGYNWRCLGCKRYGRQGETYYDPGFVDRRKAENDAQGHADDCSALPPEPEPPQKQEEQRRRGLTAWVTSLVTTEERR
ncbi:hypothetical protein FAF44_03280 [Nonomuraea sp. MG754425]|uniref:hypothetical protein n=1 Tax=Nonomuraea sp. MG754425 TaxID=2570319 RepID=UPI001F1FCE16|nr:hypothetical protein [Nonomuraea sp. MG754425]MCF6467437.1 hypothetical protein [Nonomuraea sp. MG754425]